MRCRMKTSTYIIAFIIAFLFALLSCNDSSFTQPEINSNSRIKKKFYYNYIEDNTPLKTYEYSYDNELNLEKIYHYLGNQPSVAYEYELYQYNSDKNINNRLTYSYVNNTNGWILADSTYYSYSNGILLREETFYFTTTGDNIVIVYEYDNSKVIKKFKYYNRQLENYTKYIYTEDFCTQEIMFSDSLETDTTEYIINYFENNILSSSEKFIDNNKVQVTTYTYDGNNNLTIEEARQIDLTIVRPLYYVIRYEYY